MFRTKPGSLDCLRESRCSSQSTRNDVLFLCRQRWIWKYTGLLIHLMFSFIKAIRNKNEYYFCFHLTRHWNKKKAGFYRIFHIFNWLVLTQKWKNPNSIFISVSFKVRHNFKISNSKIGESRGRWNTLIYPHDEVGRSLVGRAGNVGAVDPTTPEIAVRSFILSHSSLNEAMFHIGWSCGEKILEIHRLLDRYQLQPSSGTTWNQSGQAHSSLPFASRTRTSQEFKDFFVNQCGFAVDKWKKLFTFTPYSRF